MRDLWILERPREKAREGFPAHGGGIFTEVTTVFDPVKVGFVSDVSPIRLRKDAARTNPGGGGGGTIKGNISSSTPRRRKVKHGATRNEGNSNAATNMAPRAFGRLRKDAIGEY